MNKNLSIFLLTTIYFLIVILFHVVINIEFTKMFLLITLGLWCARFTDWLCGLAAEE